MKELLVGVGVLCVGGFILYKTLNLHMELKKRKPKDSYSSHTHVIEQPETPKMIAGYIIGSTSTLIGFILTLVGLLS